MTAGGDVIHLEVDLKTGVKELEKFLDKDLSDTTTVSQAVNAFCKGISNVISKYASLQHRN